MPGHTVGLLESNQTVKETVAEMYEKFSKAIREMREPHEFHDWNPEKIIQ